MAKWVSTAIVVILMLLGGLTAFPSVATATQKPSNASALSSRQRQHHHHDAYRDYPQYYGRPNYYSPNPFFFPLPPFWGYGWEWW